MNRPGTSRRLASAFALVGLLLCSTAVAWATPCADDCSAMATGHACCAPDLDPVDDASLNDTGCCGGSHVRCDLGQVYQPDDTSEAHDQSRNATLVRHLDATLAAERITRPRPTLRAGPLPVKPLTVRSVILLL